MKYRTLGQSGLKVSPLCLGTMTFGATTDESEAARIVGEGLRASLNLKEGGAIASDLDSLYSYIEVRLTQANLRNDDATLDECQCLLKPLSDAWAQIAPQVRHG